MPFLRFSRDKRGYESTYLVHAANRRGKPVRPRVLYWYRTPPGVKVGRPPFDESVRRLLETQNPGVIFDWKTIVSTPFPPPVEVEPWRERRRAERAAKQARRAELGEAEPVDSTISTSEDPIEAAALAVEEADAPMTDATEAVSSDVVAPAMQAPPLAGGPADPTALRRRRRRGGRRRRGRSDGFSPAPTSSQADAVPGSQAPHAAHNPEPVQAVEFLDSGESDGPADSGETDEG